MCVYVCVCVCMFGYVCVCTCVYLCECLCMYQIKVGKWDQVQNLQRKHIHNRNHIVVFHTEIKCLASTM